MELSEIIERVKQKDQAAFEELYNRYYQMGFSLALQFVKNEDDAMDIIQDSFITVCNKIDTLDNPERFKSWYMQIVANRCKDVLKKKNPMSFTDINAYDEDGNLQFDIEDEDRDFQPEEAVDYTETVNVVKGMLEELPEEQKMCLLLYYVNGLKISEIADAIGCSEATVKSRLKYGKEKLKIQVEDYEKKSGVKLHSFTGFAIIPFIKWMLGGATVSESVSGGVLRNCLAALSSSTASQAATGVAGVGKAALGFKKAVDTFNAFSLGQKIASIAVASAIVVGAAGAGYVATKNDNKKDVDNTITSTESAPANENVMIVDDDESSEAGTSSNTDVSSAASSSTPSQTGGVEGSYQEIDIYNMVRDYIIIDGMNGEAVAKFKFPDNHQQEVGSNVVFQFSGNTVVVMLNGSKIGELSLVISTPSGSTATNGSLSDGDEIIISVSGAVGSNDETGGIEGINAKLKKCGWVIVDKKHSYVVSDAGKYVHSMEDFSQQDLKAFWNVMAKKFAEYTEVATREITAMYLLELKEGKQLPSNERSGCKIMFVHVQHNNYTGEKGYALTSAHNLCKFNKDGVKLWGWWSNINNEADYFAKLYSTPEAAAAALDSQKYIIKQIIF